jgi:hypothetical protein
LARISGTSCGGRQSRPQPWAPQIPFSLKGIGESAWASLTVLIHQPYHEFGLEEIAERDVLRLDQPYARMVYDSVGEDISDSRYGEMRGR